MIQGYLRATESAGETLQVERLSKQVCTLERILIDAPLLNPIKMYTMDQFRINLVLNFDNNPV